MSLTAEDTPVIEIPGPQDDPQRAEEAARFILENLYREPNPGAGRLEEQLAGMRRRTTIAAFDGDRIVGTGSLETGVQGEAKLEDIVVLNERGYRRIGLGTKIVRRLEAMAEETEVRKIHFVSAITSVAFYQKLGYSVDATSFLACSKTLPGRA